MLKLLCVPIAVGIALVSCACAAQEPPAAPVPKLPAMPSLEQKGSDDMTRPAGAVPPAPAPKVSKPAPKAASKPAPEPKHAAKDSSKHEPEAHKDKPKGSASKNAPTKPKQAQHAAKAAKAHKASPEKSRKRR